MNDRIEWNRDRGIETGETAVLKLYSLGILSLYEKCQFFSQFPRLVFFTALHAGRGCLLCSIISLHTRFSSCLSKRSRLASKKSRKPPLIFDAPLNQLHVTFLPSLLYSIFIYTQSITSYPQERKKEKKVKISHIIISSQAPLCWQWLLTTLTTPTAPPPPPRPVTHTTTPTPTTPTTPTPVTQHPRPLSPRPQRLQSTTSKRPTRNAAISIPSGKTSTRTLPTL